MKRVLYRQAVEQIKTSPTQTAYGVDFSLNMFSGREDGCVPIILNSTQVLNYLQKEHGSHINSELPIDTPLNQELVDRRNLIFIVEETAKEDNHSLLFSFGFPSSPYSEFQGRPFPHTMPFSRSVVSWIPRIDFTELDKRRDAIQDFLRQHPIPEADLWGIVQAENVSIGIEKYNDFARKSNHGYYILPSESSGQLENLRGVLQK